MEKENLIETKQLTEKQKLLSYFFTYSFLGWILETAFCVLTLGVFNKRGFLYGPLCPMYGFAAIIMIQMLKNVKTNTLGKFAICMIFFTIFEYIVAVVLESLFGLKWWDYSNEVLNFQGRISLPYSIAWGILGVIFVEKIHPFVESKVKRFTLLMKKRTQVIIINIFVITILIDFILSVVKYINI